MSSETAQTIAIREWQTIETAPKNTEFLGYFGCGEIHVVGIDDDGKCYREMDRHKWSMPTHWMELPPEPIYLDPSVPASPPETEWMAYPGGYEKWEYDIRLHDGRQVDNCYPSAGKFHAFDSRGRATDEVIDETNVAFYRLAAKPVMGINDDAPAPAGQQAEERPSDKEELDMSAPAILAWAKAEEERRANFVIACINAGWSSKSGRTIEQFIGDQAAKLSVAERRVVELESEVEANEGYIEKQSRSFVEASQTNEKFYKDWVAKLESELAAARSQIGEAERKWQTATGCFDPDTIAIALERIGSKLGRRATEGIPDAIDRLQAQLAEAGRKLESHLSWIKEHRERADEWMGIALTLAAPKFSHNPLDHKWKVPDLAVVSEWCSTRQAALLSWWRNRKPATPPAAGEGETKPFVFEVGDLVEAIPPWALACGSGRYAYAVIVSIEPFAAVSEAGDMLWTKTISPEKVRHVGKASATSWANAKRRWEQDGPKSPSPLPSGESGDKPKPVVSYNKSLDALTAHIDHNGRWYEKWLSPHVSLLLSVDDDRLMGFEIAGVREFLPAPAPVTVADHANECCEYCSNHQKKES